MKFELFNAILSMDSYHRGYDQGIILTGSQIGNANLDIDSLILGTSNVDGDTVRNDSLIGFYALAYDIGGAGKIIAYRGTDYPSNSDNLIPDDIWNGWGTGGGLARLVVCPTRPDCVTKKALTQNYANNNMPETQRKMIA